MPEHRLPGAGLEGAASQELRPDHALDPAGIDPHDLEIGLPFRGVRLPDHRRRSLDVLDGGEFVDLCRRDELDRASADIRGRLDEREVGLILDRLHRLVADAFAEGDGPDDGRNPDRYAEGGEEDARPFPGDLVGRDLQVIDQLPEDHVTTLPSRSSMVRSVRFPSSRSWVTIRNVVSRSWFTCRIRLKISSRVFESRFPVGSSARMMRGSPTRARAIATRCCSPPLISRG